MGNLVDFKGSDEGPGVRDSKGSDNKLSETKAMSMRSNTSEISL